MNNCDASFFLLCFKRLPPLALEVICLILSIGSGVLAYFGLKHLTKIPFYLESKSSEILFFINIPFFILMVILNIIFLIFRYFELINNKLNKWGIIFSVTEIFLALFGFVFNLINIALIMTNKIIYVQNDKLIEKRWLYTKIILPIILFIWVNLFFIAFSDYILIDLKISDSYHIYKLALEDERQFEKDCKTNSNEKSNINTNIGIIIDNNNNRIENISDNKQNKVTIINNVNNMNNYNRNIKINNDINDNIGEIKHINTNDNLFSSVNKLTYDDENNMNENLKKNEEIKI